MNTQVVSLNPKDLQDLLEHIEASRSWRKRAWEKLAEIRWALKDTSGVELSAAGQKNNRFLLQMASEGSSGAFH